MAKYQRFEELPVWIEAKQLYNAVLDLFETPDLRLSSPFRYQLERAALSVANNIAEGFERATTQELQAYIAIARGSAAEVRSMIAIVEERSSFQPHLGSLRAIRDRAESCARQLTGWSGAVAKLPFYGKRRLTDQKSTPREAEQ